MRVNLGARARQIALFLASAFLAAGCHYSAGQACQKDAGLSGESLSACIEAYEDLAPRHRDPDCYNSDAGTLTECGRSYVEAEEKCLKERQDCIEILNAFETDAAPISETNGCRGQIPRTPAQGSDAWFDAANGVVNRYNGCHTGVLGYYGEIVRINLGQNPDYCIIQVDKQGVFSCAE